jgi:hypothetical protein
LSAQDIGHGTHQTRDWHAARQHRRPWDNLGCQTTGLSPEVTFSVRRRGHHAPVRKATR